MILAVIAIINVLFTIFESNVAKVDDLSPLFLNYPYLILDDSTFENYNEMILQGEKMKLQD